MGDTERIEERVRQYGIEDKGRYDVVIMSDLVFNHSQVRPCPASSAHPQHSALITTVEETLSLRPIPLETCTSGSTSGSYATPCALIFFTHHRPHYADRDMAFLPLLAQSGNGWAYEKVVEEYTEAMFAEDRGDERVRGTTHGFRAWRCRDGEARGEVVGSS
jgi:nicotinamide N-methyltransferase